MKRSTRSGWFAACVCLAAVWSPGSGQAAAISWSIPGTGNWNVSTNWNSSTIPTNVDDVYVNNGGTVQINQAGTQARSVQFATGAGATGYMTLMAGGDLVVTNPDPSFYLASAAAGTSVVTVTGGNLTCTNLIIGRAGSGTLTIQSGSVSAGWICAGQYSPVLANLDIQGGSVTAQNMDIGQSATTAQMKLSGGRLKVYGWLYGAGYYFAYSNAVSSILQTGGTGEYGNVTVPNAGAYCSYTMSGGVANVAGVFYYSGNAITCTGLLDLAGGQLTVNGSTQPNVGPGTMIVRGGTHQFPGSLYVTANSRYLQSPGTVVTTASFLVYGASQAQPDAVISGGTLTTTNFYIGTTAANTGTVLVCSNASVDVRGYLLPYGVPGNLIISNNAVVNAQRDVWIADAYPNCTGMITMAGGSLIVTNAAEGNFIIGRSGTGILTMNDGYVETKLAFMGQYVNAGIPAHGIFRMNGGTFRSKSDLQLCQLYGSTTYSEVIQTGGTIDLEQDLWLGVGGNVPTNYATYTLTGGVLKVKRAFRKQGATVEGPMFNFDGGTLSMGSWNGSIGTLTNRGGAISPGHTLAGYTSISSDYIETTNQCAFDIQIGGTTKANAFTNGTGYYDSVAVSGNATLNGKLRFSMLNGFESTCQGADQFQILTAASVIGTFDGIPNNGRVYSSNFSFRVTYSATDVKLTDFWLIKHAAVLIQLR